MLIISTRLFFFLGSCFVCFCCCCGSSGLRWFSFSATEFRGLLCADWHNPIAAVAVQVTVKVRVSFAGFNTWPNTLQRRLISNETVPVPPCAPGAGNATSAEPAIGQCHPPHWSDDQSPVVALPTYTGKWSMSDQRGDRLVGKATPLQWSVSFSTNICHDKRNFVMTKLLSRQAYFCRDKHVFVVTKHVSCRDKHDKYLSRQNVCRDKNILLRQNCVRQTRICRKATPLQWSV